MIFVFALQCLVPENVMILNIVCYDDGRYDRS